MDCILTAEQKEIITEAMSKREYFMETAKDMQSKLKEAEVSFKAFTDKGGKPEDYIGAVLGTDVTGKYVGTNLESLTDTIDISLRGGDMLDELEAKIGGRGHILVGTPAELNVAVKAEIIDVLMYGGHGSDLSNRVLDVARNIQKERNAGAYSEGGDRELINNLIDLDAPAYASSVPGLATKMAEGKIDAYDMISSVPRGDLDKFLDTYASTSLKGSINQFSKDTALKSASLQMFGTTKIRSAVDGIADKIIKNNAEKDIVLSKTELIPESLLNVATNDIYIGGQKTRGSETIKAAKSFAAFTQLGQAVVAALAGDPAIGMQKALMSGNLGDYMKNLVTSFDGATKTELREMGIAIEEYGNVATRGILETQGEATGWAQNLALTTIKATGLEKATNNAVMASRNTVYRSMQEELSDVIQGGLLENTTFLKHIYSDGSSIKPYNHMTLEEKRVFSAGVITEARMYQIMPTNRTTSLTRFKGTGVLPETASAFTQYLSFTVESYNALRLQMNRATTNGEKAKIMASVLVLGTIGGALTLTIKDMINNRSPREWDEKFFMEALGQNPSLAIVSSISKSFTGGQNSSLPAFSAVVGVGKGLYNVGSDLSQGKDPDAGSEAIRAGSRFVPNLWFISAMTRELSEEIQKAVDPQAAGRRRRAYQRRLKKSEQTKIIPIGVE